MGNAQRKVTILAEHRHQLAVVKEFVSQNEFQDLLETIEIYLNTIKPNRKMPEKIDEAIGYVQEIKFCGMFSLHFRQQYIRPLEELADELYYEIHGDEDDVA
ncbi:MAG TPA: hypothetical protein VGE97_08940 [Nitrososphaera sp.]|jgi:hypothetical protein